jgi:hypothetical protein
MKSFIFSEAIKNRNSINFLYGLDSIKLDPYFTTEEHGKKFIYGCVPNTHAIKRFEYSRIVNIKIDRSKRFSPLIPIMSLAG